MYKWDTLVLLKHLLEEGLSKTAIAERLGVSRRMIYYWISTGQLDRGSSDASVPVRVRARRPTKLDPYRLIIQERLALYPKLSAVRLFAEVKAAGYRGGESQLRAFVRQVRPRAEPEPVVRFETAPGKQAQVDFAEFRLPWGKRFALLVVLGYSRLLWMRFYPYQTMQTVISGLEDAFAFFGGVPEECLFDQMKAVVVSDDRLAGGKLLENPEFMRFAAHWGFRIRACRPYRAKTKGKVERPVRYVRDNFFYGRDFLGDGDLDAQNRRWLEDVANARVHGTTGKVPRVHLEQEEQSFLRPLAPRPYRPVVLGPERSPSTSARVSVATPRIRVERRPLTAYANLAAGGRA